MKGSEIGGKKTYTEFMVMGDWGMIGGWGGGGEGGERVVLVFFFSFFFSFHHHHHPFFPPLYKTNGKPVKAAHSK